jgi:hypothetical protein
MHASGTKVRVIPLGRSAVEIAWVSLIRSIRGKEIILPSGGGTISSLSGDILPSVALFKEVVVSL